MMAARKGRAAPRQDVAQDRRAARIYRLERVRPLPGPIPLIGSSRRGAENRYAVRATAGQGDRFDRRQSWGPPVPLASRRTSGVRRRRSEEETSELQTDQQLVFWLLLEKHHMQTI